MSDHKVPANFYDLDAILALSSNVPCTIQKSIDDQFFTQMLGMKRPESVDDKGHKLEVPLWLLSAIQEHCEPSLPYAFNTAMQGVMKADATHVNLERIQQYYYEFGVELCRLLKGRDTETAIQVARTMWDTFVQRIGGIIQKAIQGGKPEKMDQLERKLFEECVESNAQMLAFMGFSSSNLSKSKRKRSA